MLEAFLTSFLLRERRNITTTSMRGKDCKSPKACHLATKNGIFHVLFSIFLPYIIKRTKTLLAQTLLSGNVLFLVFLFLFINFSVYPAHITVDACIDTIVSLRCTCLSPAR